MGTAGGIKHLAGSTGFDETFVVVMGDALTDVDVREAVSFHKEKEALATLALTRVEDTSGYGVVELDGEGNILRFQEKPLPCEAASNLDSIRHLRPGARGLGVHPQGHLLRLRRGRLPRAAFVRGEGSRVRGRLPLLVGEEVVVGRGRAASER